MNTVAPHYLLFYLVVIEGLRRFFGKCWASLRPSGYFVLELQEWGSYERAAKKIKPLKENLQKLEIRPEHFELILGGVGFDLLHKIDDKGLKRSIFIYRRK